MSNDQNKAGTNPISNKQLGTAPVPLIMPSARHPSAVAAGKSAKPHKQGPQHDQDQPAVAGEQTLSELPLVSDDGTAEQSLASAEAAMSVRRSKGGDDETDQDKPADVSSDESRLLLAQAGDAGSGGSSAGSGGNLDAPVSVGEELLRQAAPLPSTPSKSGPDWLESLFGKDWKLPVALGGGALALLGLAVGGGGSSAAPAGTGAAGGDTGSTPAPPSNAWTLTVTPAAGKFESTATVRAAVQKWDGRNWQDVADTTTVDRFGRMSIKVDKSQVSAQDMLRVVLSDNGSGADHRDEVGGLMTLGSTPLIALIGGLASDQQVTVNPLTTLAAQHIGQDLSAATIEAVHAAVAKAFGISSGDLVHVLPSFLAGGGSPVKTTDSQNYGLALGVLAGMAQAQRDAGVAGDQALGAALNVLAQAFDLQDGKPVLNLDKIRSIQLNKADGSGLAQVGLDEGAARLYQASAVTGTGAEGAQIPYITIDTQKEKIPGGLTPTPGADVTLGASNFADGLTLKVNTADSAKEGDSLRIEFIKLDGNGSPVQDAKPFIYDYVLTKKDVDQVGSTAGNAANKGGGYFNLVVPTHLDDPAKYNSTNGARAAQSSSSDASVFLLPVKMDPATQTSYYDVAKAVTTQYQLRATGSALGFASAGARISLGNAPVVVESAPPGNIFNGGDVSSANTIHIAVTLSTRISWDHAPTLNLMIGGKPFTASVQNLVGSTSDVLNFSLTLSNKDGESTQGLEGDLKIPENALQFPPGTTIFADGGATLFVSDNAGKWSDHQSQSISGEIAQFLGVESTSLVPPYKVDTIRPANPTLELGAVLLGVGNDGFRQSDRIPVDGQLNAIAGVSVSNSSQFAYSVVTNNIKQEFTVHVNQSDLKGDAGASVRLLVSAPNITNTVLANAVLDANGNATFTTQSYVAGIVERLTSAAKAPAAADGLPINLFAQITDKAGNVSAMVPLTFPMGAGGNASFTLDMTAPAAPVLVKLDAASDTGRDGGVNTNNESRSDNITSIKKPSLLVQGGSLGSVIEVWRDENLSQKLGSAVVGILPGSGPSTNGATVALSGGELQDGVNKVYTTIIDQAGNRSPSKSVDLTYLPPIDQEASRKLVLDVTSAKPASGFYRQGEVIEVSVKFDRPVFLKAGKTTSNLFVDLIANGVGSQPDQIGKATFFDGLGTDTLRFKYTVAQNIDDGNTGVFTARTFINQDSVLEDIAGSNVVVAGAKPRDGQEVKIDTIAPIVPVIELPADVKAAPASGKFGRGTATTEGLSLSAESGSQVRLSFKRGDMEVLSKTETGTGAPQSIVFTDADLNKLGQGDLTVSASATDPAGNSSAFSSALAFKIDTDAPVATVVGAFNIAKQPNSDVPTNGPTNVPFYFTIQFSEGLKTIPTKEHFEATRGSVTDVKPVSSTANTYRVTIQPDKDVAAGNVELSLKAGLANPLSDNAGNLIETGKTIATQAIDTLGPQITATRDVDGPVMGSAPVSFTVTLSEPVGPIWGDMDARNFSATNGTIASVTRIDALKYKVTVTPTTTPAGGNITLGLIADARSVGGSVLRDALGNQTMSQSALVTQVIDVTPPQVMERVVTGKVAPGNSSTASYFHVGDTVTVKVTFNEAVSVTGRPTVDIDVGGVLRTAVFSGQEEGVDGKKTVLFDYTIVAGDHAAAGIALPADGIRLAGGRISDLAGNLAVLTTPAKTENADVKVDTIIPTVEEVKILSATGTPAEAAAGIYKTGAELTAAVRFSEEIRIDTATGSAPAPTLALKVGDNIRTATFKSLDADKKTLLFTYTLTNGDNDAAGVVIPAAALSLQNARITDLSGNSATIGNLATPPNPGFKVDSTAPVINSIELSATAADGSSPGAYRAGDKITALVRFSEDVRIDTAAGLPTLTLQVGQEQRQATYQPNGGSTTGRAFSFVYTIVPNDRADTGVAVVASSLDPKNAVLSDVAGNIADLRHAALPVNTSLKVDNNAPSVVSFSATADKTLIIGDTLSLKAKVSEPLRAGGKLAVTLNNGGTATLEVDSSDPTQLLGRYTVQAGETFSGLKVDSFTTTAKDLAGNDLGTVVPTQAGTNIDVRPINVDALRPPQPTAFQLDAASDAGTAADGLTNVTRPSFHFEGLTRGARVVVTATSKGAELTLLDFVATGAAQTVAMSGAALTDGIYSNVVVKQTSANGNASEPLRLGKTSTSGSFQIDTAAPSATPTNLAFDDIQDSLSDKQYSDYLSQANDAKARGTQARDYRTSIQQPRFDFMGGNDGEVAVLFRDVNGNNRFDSGDVELGRKTIGPDSVIQYKTGINVSEANKSGHFVEVNAASALPNTTYADIKVVLQTASGTFGTASAAAIGGLTVFNNAPLPSLTRVQASQNTPTDPTAETTLSFDITGGRVGATVKFMADLTDSSGAMTTAGVVVGQGLLVAGKVNINTAALNGTYRNFKAVQTYAGQDSSAVDVVKQDGTGLTMTWDHIAPTVQVALKSGTVARVGQPVELLFTFSENVKDFTKDDITVVGGQIDSVTGTGSTRTAIFTPDNATSSGASVEVKAGSYTDAANNVGAGSDRFAIPFNRPGSVQLSGMRNANAPQVGETLLATVSDPDGNPTGLVTYGWTVNGTPVPGNNTASYQVTEADKGKTIKVSADYTDGAGGDEVVASGDTAAVTGPNAPVKVVIKVNDNEIGLTDRRLNYGDHVQVIVTDDDGLPAGYEQSFKWLDGASIPQNNILTPLDFMVTEAVLDKNKLIHLTGKFVDRAGNQEEYFQPGDSMKVWPRQQMGDVSIVDANGNPIANTVKLQLGQLVVASIVDGNDYSSGNARYEWTVDGVTRPNNSGMRYEVQETDYGKQIKVHVTYVDDDGYSEDLTSKALTVDNAPNNMPASGEVTVTGSGKVGTVLMASHGQITDPDGTANSVYSYKWYLVGTDGNSQEISRDHYKGSDSSTLVVTSDLLGKGEIKAELNFNDERGHRETIRSSTGISPELPSSFNAIPLSFTGVTAPANSPRLILVDKVHSLYLLDVNGDNAIDQRDATTYITNLDASGGLTVQGQNGQVRATLLGSDSNLWSQLALGSTAWGSATGVKGSYGNSAADDVPAQDFWTATANGSSAHYVWATPASGGVYSSANASSLGDPNRAHYNLFELKYTTGGVLPG